MKKRITSVFFIIAFMFSIMPIAVCAASDTVSALESEVHSFPDEEYSFKQNTGTITLENNKVSYPIGLEDGSAEQSDLDISENVLSGETVQTSEPFHSDEIITNNGCTNDSSEETIYMKDGKGIAENFSGMYRKTVVITDAIRLSRDITVGNNNQSDRETQLILESRYDEKSGDNTGKFIANGKKITINETGKFIVHADVSVDESAIVSGVSGKKVCKKENEDDETVTYYLEKGASADSAKSTVVSNSTIKPTAMAKSDTVCITDQGTSKGYTGSIIPKLKKSGIGSIIVWVILLVVSGIVLSGTTIFKKKTR